MLDDVGYVNAFADRGNWDQGTANAVVACQQGAQVVHYALSLSFKAGIHIQEYNMWFCTSQLENMFLPNFRERKAISFKI